MVDRRGLKVGTESEMGGTCEGDNNMSGERKFGAEKGTEDCHMSSDWPYNGDNLPGYSMGLTSSAACEGNVIDSVSCATDPMMSCGPDSWIRAAVAPNVGFCGIDEGNNASTVSMLENLRGRNTEMMRPMFDGGWNPLPKGGLFLPSGPGVLHRSLSQFPSDCGFIERAARFSCFGSGNFSDTVNTCNAPESISPLSKGRPIASGPLSFEYGVNMARASMVTPECADENGSLLRNNSVARSRNESRQGLDASSNESDEAILRSHDGREEPSMIEGAGGETGSARAYGANKRKRAAQNARANKINGVPQKSVEGTRLDAEPQLGSEQNPCFGANNKASENTEQKSQHTETPKEEYIHVRARRGQATNSHSLAERVRREKISERMKFLQDLVPGCRKVIGKAVMLDEIINYVQSLQRQVEFLSMKLATVNPRLDFDIESFLTKDMFQSRAGPSSSLGLQPDVSMPYAHLLPSPTAQYNANLSTSGHSADMRRTMSSHMAAIGYKEPNPQLANMWDNDLHNVVHMGFNNSSKPAKSQELSDSYQSDPMKPEP